MKLHRMCSMSGKSHQSNGSSELSPSILLRGRSGGRMPQIVAGRGWWVGEGSRPSARLTPASSLSHPSQMGRQATGSQAVLLCYKVPTGVFVCVWRVWAQTNTAWWTKGRMIIRKTLPSAGQKTTSPHVGNECFTGRRPSSCMFEIWHVLCEHWMTSRILSNNFHLWRNNLLCKWLHI